MARLVEIDCAPYDDGFRVFDANGLDDVLIAGHFGVRVEQVEEKRWDPRDHG